MRVRAPPLLLLLYLLWLLPPPLILRVAAAAAAVVVDVDVGCDSWTSMMSASAIADRQTWGGVGGGGGRGEGGGGGQGVGGGGGRAVSIQGLICRMVNWECGGRKCWW